MYSGYADPDPASGVPNGNGGIRASTFRLKRGNNGMDYDSDYSGSSWNWPVMKGNVSIVKSRDVPGILVLNQNTPGTSLIKSYFPVFQPSPLQNEVVFSIQINENIQDNDQFEVL